MGGYDAWKEQEEEQEEGIARELRKCGSKVMGKGKFKNKATGERQFSTIEEILAGTSTARPATFQKRSEEVRDATVIDNTQEHEMVERSDRRKGVEGLIEVENPNLGKPMNVKLKNIDFGKQTELSRREREEVERSMKLREQGKTEQGRKDLERLSLLRHEREIAAKRREEERAAKEEAGRRKPGSRER